MDTLLVQPNTQEQLEAVKSILMVLKVNFSIKKDENYEPEFVQKILESSAEAKAGKVTKIKIEDLWK